MFGGSPFLMTWFTSAVGELASLLIGAIIMDKLGKRIDLTYDRLKTSFLGSFLFSKIS